MKDFFKAMWQNIKDLPRDIKLVFGNRHRRRNFVWRTVESLIGFAVFLFFYKRGNGFLGSFLLAYLAEFIAFEYVAEPAGWTAYYFERGPREHEGEWPNTGWWEE